MANRDIRIINLAELLRIPSKNTLLHTFFQVIDTVEIAHTFQLGTKYTLPFEAVSPTRHPLFMCCFGIGITRLIAARYFFLEFLSSSDSPIKHLALIMHPYPTKQCAYHMQFHPIKQHFYCPKPELQIKSGISPKKFFKKWIRLVCEIF